MFATSLSGKPGRVSYQKLEIVRLEKQRFGQAGSPAGQMLGKHTASHFQTNLKRGVDQGLSTIIDTVLVTHLAQFLDTPGFQVVLIDFLLDGRLVLLADIQESDESTGAPEEALHGPKIHEAFRQDPPVLPSL